MAYRRLAKVPKLIASSSLNTPYCFVHVPHPFDWNPLSDEEMVTIVDVVTLSFAMMSSMVPPNPLSLA